jgi:hypothetical protein
MEAIGKWFILHPSRSDVLTIYNLADLHIMSPSCAEDEIRSDIEDIRMNPNAFWFGGGDYANYITATDKRFNPDEFDEKTLVKDMGKLGWVAKERVKALFTPIRHKCLGLLFGNHEFKYAVAKEQLFLHHLLCTELDVLDMGYCCYFDTVFLRVPAVEAPTLTQKYPEESVGDYWCVRHFAHHGAGFATTPAGKLNKLLEFMNSFPQGDISWCGHVHDQKGQRIAGIVANPACDKIMAKERLGVISGGYQKTYQQHVTSYGEMRGYRPTILGPAVVRFTPKDKTYKGEI